MSNATLGKKFEEVFAHDWQKSFPGTFLLRLHDLTSGYKVVSQQPCDYIAFVEQELFLLEIKSHKKASIPFTAIPQYDRLLKYANMSNINPYIIIWYIDYDKVIAVPILEAKKIVDSGKKSISIKILEDKSYNIIEIPSIKKRVFLESDYSILLNK